MVQSLKISISCARRANRADFLADGGKVLEDNGCKKRGLEHLEKD